MRVPPSRAVAMDSATRVPRSKGSERMEESELDTADIRYTFGFLWSEAGHAKVRSRCGAADRRACPAGRSAERARMGRPQPFRQALPASALGGCLPATRCELVTNFVRDRGRSGNPLTSPTAAAVIREGD